MYVCMCVCVGTGGGGGEGEGLGPESFVQQTFILTAIRAFWLNDWWQKA